MEVFDKTRHIFECDTVENLKFTRILLQDVENAEDRAIIIEETFNRAHSRLDENYNQIIRLYYLLNLYTKHKEFIKNFKICNKNNYSRQPIKIAIGEAPIPTRLGWVK